MSLSETRVEHGAPFRIRVENYWGGVSAESKIKVYDSRDRVRCSGNGEINTRLPRGLYTVRMERAGQMTEEIVRHANDTSKNFAELRRYSAVPSFDTKNTHEYYSENSAEWSTKNTANAAQLLNAVDASRLFIFIRGRGEADYSEVDLARGLSLYTEYATLITRFDDSVTVGDRKNGWLAFSAPIPAGRYLLAHAARPARVMPVHVHPSWDSQLFVPFERHVRLEGTSFFFARRQAGFNPGDRLTQAMDAALIGLQNRLDLMPADLRRDALFGKFDSPMLGLIGAHALLLTARPSGYSADNILRNLWNLLPGSTDVAALLMLAAGKFHWPLRDVGDLQHLAEEKFGERIELPLRFPPMLRLGLNAVLRTSAQIPGLVAEGSLLENISMNLYGDSPWSIWEPEVGQVQTAERPPAPDRRKLYSLVKGVLDTEYGIPSGSVRSDHRLRGRRLNLSENDILDLGRRLNRRLKGVGVELPAEPLRQSRTVRDVVDAISALDSAIDAAGDIAEALLKPNPDVPAWLMNLIGEHLQHDGNEFDIQALAKQLSIPARLVQRAVEAFGPPMPRPQNTRTKSQV